MAVVCAAAGLPCPVVQPCLAYPSAVLVSTAVVSCTVRCWVCGVWVGVCLCAVRVVGYPPLAPPLVVMVGWHSVEGRGVVDGGVV